jgi:Fe-S-cluster containining protein
VNAELATLCQSCGLCCDGSLFGRVSLGPEEIAPARRNRLHVLRDGKGFEQPCAALSVREAPDGARGVCRIYDERPLSCRKFECRLYDRHRREGGPLEPRLAAVQRVRQLVADLHAQGVNPADFDGDSSSTSPPGAAAMQMHAELQQRLEEDFARA